MSGAVVPNLLPPLRLQLAARLPSVVLSIEEGLESNLLSMLSEGRLDCILGRVVPERLTQDLRHEVPYREPTVIVSAADHPVATARAGRRLMLLSNSEWVLPSSSGASYNMVASRLSLEGLPAPRVAVEVTSMFVTLELVSRSRMLSAIPMRLAHAQQQMKRLYTVPVELMASVYPVGVMYRRDRGSDDVLRTVIEAAKQTVELLAE